MEKHRGLHSSTPSYRTEHLLATARDRQTYQIAFLADNPGIWMDHCHNLPHAAQGLVTHLMYEGITTPYRIDGPAKNQPE